MENQIDYDLQPKTWLADTAYGADENVEACREGGTEQCPGWSHSAA
jgi:hypothetical protein